MDRKVFVQAAANNALHGAYLLEGVEENIRNAAVEQVRKVLLPEGLEQLNETILENPDTSAIIAAAETLPVMADRRLVIIREHSALNRGEADDRLLEYLPHVPDTAVVLFIHRGKADTRRKLYKAIDKLKNVVSFNTLTDAELTDWICRRFAKAGRNCSVLTASQLVFTSGNDTQQLRTEIDKLIAYTEGRDSVTDEDIRAVATRSVSYTVFLLVDAVVAGQEAKAFGLLRDMLTSGEERIGILAMLLRQYRMLQMVKIMQYEKRSAQQMQELLGVASFVLDRCIRQAKGLTGGQERRAVELCLDTEYRIKSGQLAQDGALESCMLQLLLLKKPNA